MTKLSSDIVSLEGYFEGLVIEDPTLKSFVLETSNNPFELERFDAVSKLDGFDYPALVLMMPVITGDDNEMHNFEARQELAFVTIYATNGEHSERLAKHKLAQDAAWRIIKFLRRDSKAGKFRFDRLNYKMAPIEYGSDNCVGQYVVLSIITSTNSLIGV